MNGAFSSLEIIMSDNPDVSQNIASQLEMFPAGLSAGFLIDARNELDGVYDNPHIAFQSTNILSNVLEGARIAFPERCWTGSAPLNKALLSRRDLNYHRDTSTPSPTIVFRIHYAASGERELLFSNELPGLYLSHATEQGYETEYKHSAIEASGTQHPGMFAIFAVAGGVLSEKDLVIPTKHWFQTVSDREIEPVVWSRADISSTKRVLPSEKVHDEIPVSDLATKRPVLV